MLAGLKQLCLGWTNSLEWVSESLNTTRGHLKKNRSHSPVNDVLCLNSLPSFSCPFWLQRYPFHRTFNKHPFAAKRPFLSGWFCHQQNAMLVTSERCPQDPKCFCYSKSPDFNIHFDGNNIIITSWMDRWITVKPNNSPPFKLHLIRTSALILSYHFQ